MTIEQLKRDESLKRLDFRQWNEMLDAQSRVRNFLEHNESAGQLAFENAKSLADEISRIACVKGVEWEAAESAYTKAIFAEDEARESMAQVVAHGSGVSV